MNEAEAFAIVSANQVRTGATNLGIAIHEIFTNELWRTEVDEVGIPVYQTQEHYISHFTQLVGISRSSLYNYLKPVRVIKALDMTYDDYYLTGGYDTWGKASRYMRIEEGEVKLHRELPEEIDVKKYIIENVRELHAAVEVGMPQADLHKEVKDRFAGESSITYNWDGPILEYTVERADSSIAGGEFRDTMTTPIEVVTDLTRRLNIVDQT